MIIITSSEKGEKRKQLCGKCVYASKNMHGYKNVLKSHVRKVFLLTNNSPVNREYSKKNIKYTLGLQCKWCICFYTAAQLLISTTTSTTYFYFFLIYELACYRCCAILIPDNNLRTNQIKLLFVFYFTVCVITSILQFVLILPRYLSPFILEWQVSLSLLFV